MGIIFAPLYIKYLGIKTYGRITSSPQVEKVTHVITIKGLIVISRFIGSLYHGIMLGSQKQSRLIEVGSKFGIPKGALKKTGQQLSNKPRLNYTTTHCEGQLKWRDIVLPTTADISEITQAVIAIAHHGVG
ncbi:MAG: hypothetical protein ACXWT1_01710 [Methylobacter sp.]